MLLILRKAVQLPFELLTVSRSMVREDYPKQWLKLALFSLLLSGFFSFIIVIARTPWIAGLISDPHFARKSLVLHVDFALVIWFYAFLSALYLSLVKNINAIFFSAGLKLALAGSFLMIIPVFIQSAEPILANYIPVLDHPLFTAGLLLIAAGLFTTFSQRSTETVESAARPSFYSDSAAITVRYAGSVVIVGILTIITAWILTPELASRTTYFEVIMWGGGHILQFANVLGMLAVWMILTRMITGREIASARTNRWLISILAIPAVLSPVLMAQGTTSQFYYGGFTQLMRWFIFPVVSIYIILAVRTLWLWKKESQTPTKLFHNFCFNGLLVSILLTITGFILGAMIRDSSTLIPAHYHASLGGVTVAYMVMVFILMKEYGYSVSSRRGKLFLRWQPLLFGFGQTLFVIGFAIAGLMGMGRKLYGQEQNIYTPEALAGLGLMSGGGLLAMAGGLLFICIIVMSYNRGKMVKHTPGPTERNDHPNL
jgi:cytochrome c oxidase subunit I